MRGRKNFIKHTCYCVLVIVIAFSLPLSVVFADPPVATPKTVPGHEPPIPRGLPDLTPYWKFDPPRSSQFDLRNLTVSGDMRIRPELRSNGTFGFTKSNVFFVQQWMRLGLNYAISPDVDVFFQPQYAKNFGAAAIPGTGLPGGCTGNICANDSFNVGQAGSLFVRQAFLIIRNFGLEGLSLKAGRQMIVMGNHRLFGHFDWANTGFSHDGVTLRYAQPGYEIWGGWLRPADLQFAAPFSGGNTSSFGLIPAGANTVTAKSTANLYFTRLVFKPIAGLSIEPLWVLLTNGFQSLPCPTSAAPGCGVLQAHAPNQTRHTLGGRVAFRRNIPHLPVSFDGTAEAYWQTGSIGITPGNSSQNLHINASAAAVEGGFTFENLPWQPRIGAEFNFASGDGNGRNCRSDNIAACNGHADTFENLYPTNHILMGYADLLAWRNMTAYSGSFQFKPQRTNHVEARFWVFRKSNAGDCWYRAAQNCYLDAVVGNTAANATTSSSLGRELDIIFTQFLKGNKVGWQVGYAHFWAGQFVTQALGHGGVGQDWAYTQLHVNF